MEALNKHIVRAISLLNPEVTQTCEAVLQNRMALDVLTATQVGCALT